MARIIRKRRDFSDDNVIIQKLKFIGKSLSAYARDLGRYLSGKHVPDKQKTILMKILSPIHNTIRKIRIMIRLITDGNPMHYIGAAAIAASVIIPLAFAYKVHKANKAVPLGVANGHGTYSGTNAYGEVKNAFNARGEVLNSAKEAMKDISNRIKHNARRMNEREANYYTGGETITIGDSARRLRRRKDGIGSLIAATRTKLSQFIAMVKQNAPQALGRIKPLVFIKRKLDEFYRNHWADVDLSWLAFKITAAIGVIGTVLVVMRFANAAHTVAKEKNVDRQIASDLKKLLMQLLGKVKTKAKNARYGNSSYNYGFDNEGEYINVGEGGYSVA